MAHFIDGPHQDFALRVGTARHDKGLTQGQLADALHVDRRTVSQWENGHSLPRGPMMKRLANALGMEPLYLARGETRETMQWMARNYAERDRSNLFDELQMLFIEPWEAVAHGNATPFGKPRFSPKADKPWLSADIKQFVPVGAKFGDSLRAARLPAPFPGNGEYQSGAVVIFGPAFAADGVPSGVDVLYTDLGGTEAVRIRRMFHAAGSQPLLVSFDPTEAPILADPLDIKMIGIVHSVWTPKYMPS